MKYKTMDANEAVSLVAYKFSELCGIYPITPASPMAERIDIMSKSGELNFWNNPVTVREMQSEAGAAALIHGALQGGSLATSFTASQGLLLMIPSLYKMSGEMLPAVIHVAARSISTHALSIFGDHQDVYATRMTGVCLLASSNPKQAYHLSMVAHLAAIKSSLPFIHFFDGFRTSHEINKIPLINLDEVGKLIDHKALMEFRKKAINIDNPNTRGTSQNDDIYFQNMEVRNHNYETTIKIVDSYMKKINKLTNENYKPFNYYGSKEADKVIVSMGSGCNVIKEVIDKLNSTTNHRYGLIEVHLYRPFSREYLLKEIPSTVKKIAVLDRTKEPGSTGEPLYLDVVEALKDTSIKIYGGRYGLSSKNVTPAQIKSVYDNLEKGRPLDKFTIGIVDDVTNLSLEVDDSFMIDNNNFELLIYGYGSDGMISTSKDLLKIIGGRTNYFVQGYFQYDSKKSGGITRSHIRIGKKEINSSYYVERPKMIVVSKDNYLYKYNILDNIQDNGILLLNTSLTEKELCTSLPNPVKKALAQKNITLYYLDAYKIVNNYGLGNKISTALEICILKLLKVTSLKRAQMIMKEQNELRFKRKGKKIIDINNQIVEEASKYLKKLPIDSKWQSIVDVAKFKLSFNEKIEHLQGNDLPVSAFLDYESGIFEGNTAILEKRAIAQNVPYWHSENCIQCNKCAFVCPHGVIRPFLLSSKKDNITSIPAMIPKGYEYTVGISYEDCTSCGLCANVCPGKLGKKALTMKKYENESSDDFNYLLANNVNDKSMEILNVKNIGFKQPRFAFSGACAGCGETPYLKNLTQLVGKNMIISNATGCSSIYSSSIPNMPYDLPWTSSLFEDNSEYGLGIYQSNEIQRLKIKDYMEKNLHKDKEIFNLWLNNMDNYEICLEVKNKINYQENPQLKELKKYLLPTSMWIIGGDGFAYDIGYGGLDHVLSTNANINILVLDTEVYSNTGGQASKSSNIGAIAAFEAHGKKTYKKDLAKIAMCYPHVYVASCNIGYNSEQYLQTIKEASEYPGPSLIIAYAPCIEHGIKEGMMHSIDNAKLAGECGYSLIFRYNPLTEEFKFDSKNVDFSKYHDFLMSERRYANLYNFDKKQADILLEEQKNWAIKRYNYYQSLANK